jgi:transcriptional regulator with XRE-family HTH domain
MLFGDKLSVERKKYGLSAEELAIACNVARSYITLIENNKRLPGKKVISKIAEALHLEKIVIVNWYLESIREKLRQ